MDRERLKGHLPLLLLAVLESRELHGYAVLDELRKRSGGELDLPEGTVYPALHRLESSGLLKSRWETTEGRRRRIYSTTAKGRRALIEERRTWSVFARVVTAVSGGAP